MPRKSDNWIKALKPVKPISAKEPAKPGVKIAQSKLTKSLPENSPLMRKQTNTTRTLRGIRK